MRRMGPLRFAHPPHLPPPSVAPIIEFYDVNLARLPDEYRLEAPVDDRGIVDLLRTVDLALELVDPSYQWQAMTATNIILSGRGTFTSQNIGRIAQYPVIIEKYHFIKDYYHASFMTFCMLLSHHRPFPISK